MNRDLAFEPVILDGAINIARAKLTARIIAAVKKYEPRAQVVSVTYQGSGESALKPTVKVAVEDGTV